MTFIPVLTADQLATCRQLSWSGGQYVSLCDNVVAFAARVSADVNAEGSGQITAAAVPYNTVTVGAYTDLDEGMICIVSPTSDMRNPLASRFRLRWRVADGSSLYTNEFSDPLSSGDYIWVLYAYDALDRLSRPTGAGLNAPVGQKKDFDLTFQRLAPIINGAQMGYASWVDGDGYYTIPFDLSSSWAAEYSATISSYLATVTPTGSGTYSVIAGALNTSAFTIQLTYGEYWLKLTATDSNGVVQYRHILIKAHDPTNYPPNVYFEGVEITRDAENPGQAGGRVKAYRGVDTLLNGTMCIVWVEEQYSDPNFENASGSLINNIDLVGWIESEENNYTTDATYSAYAEVAFEIQPLAGRLARVEGQLLCFKDNASPTLWDQINHLTPWRAIVHFLQRHTTALNFADFTVDSATDTFRFPTITTIAGRALDNVTGKQGIAEMINAQLEFAADGRMQLVRRLPFVTGAHTSRGTWDTRDFTGELRWKLLHYEQEGYLDADGAMWVSGSTQVIPYLSRAPGIAMGSGADQGKLNNQILAYTAAGMIGTGQVELNQRSGTAHAMNNNTWAIEGTFMDQWHWLEPSFGECWVWSLDTTVFIRGVTLDSNTQWMIKTVRVQHDNAQGVRTVEVTTIPIRVGYPGYSVPIVGSGTVDPSLPELPPMPAFPGVDLPPFPDLGLTPDQINPASLPAGILLDGEELLIWDDDHLLLLGNFIALRTPKYTEVTPSSL